MTITDAAAKLEESKKTEAVQLEEQRASLIQILDELQGVEGVEPFVIEDDEDLQFIANMLKDMKKQYKELEARRKTVTKPMHDALVAFRAFYKPTLDVLKELEKLLKSKIGEYTLKQQELEEQKAKELAAAARDKDFERALAVSSTMREVPKVDGITVSEKWDYEIVSKEAVPEWAKEVSDAAVRTYIKEFGKTKPADVPGLRFFKVGGVSATTR